MKESTQTVWFLGAAVAAVVLAYGTRPSDATFDVSTLAGQMINQSFEPEEAKSLRIVRFDEETATLREFEVAERNGVWSIPSKGNYPADADQQMARASTTVMDREILRVVSQSAANHVEYGVVAPSDSLDIDATGVGTRVTLAGEGHKELVDIVVGKEVKDASGQHYVRRVSQDVVYVTEISPDDLSTHFSDWIEDDLLGIDPFDIASVQIKDYTTELVPQGFRLGVALTPRTEMTAVYDDEASAWKPGELLAYVAETKAHEPFELDSSEELNTETLDELKRALDDLRIVDVEKKPVALSNFLKEGGDFAEDQESALDLAEHGFAPTKDADGSTRILSTEGEVICSLSDGVDYLLRFGNLQVGSEETSSASDGEEAEAEDSIHRYMFVVAQFNDAGIASPDLEELPELPEGVTEEDNSDEEDEPTEEADETPESETNNEHAELLEQRREIRRRNRQKLDEYEQKIESAKEKVDVLNSRFADWYYVVSNDIFQKVRLGRDDLITTKEEPDTSQEEDPADPAAGSFGAPGTAIPGLPEVP